MTFLTSKAFPVLAEASKQLQRLLDANHTTDLDKVAEVDLQEAIVVAEHALHHLIATMLEHQLVTEQFEKQLNTESETVSEHIVMFRHK